jgi:hypothetical protein
MFSQKIKRFLSKKKKKVFAQKQRFNQEKIKAFAYRVKV